MHNPTTTDVHPVMVVSTTRRGQVGAESRFLGFSPLHERGQL
jgi:hypothetical protein